MHVTLRMTIPIIYVQITLVNRPNLTLNLKKYSVKSHLALLKSSSQRKSEFMGSCSYHFTRLQSAADCPPY